MFVGADGRTFTGAAGVEALMRERFKAAHVRGGTITQDGVRMEGALVYEWGHAAIDVESSRGTASSRGRYVTVWKRAADGRWRIWRNLSLPE